MHGMPILTHAIFAFERSGWPSYQPELRFALRAPDEFTIFIDTVKEVEMLADDIPLCSLEQVIKNLEGAIKSGFIRKVFDLQFGFALYNDPNFPKGSRSTEDAECYYAVPSWVAHCIFIDNPKADYSFDATSPDDPNRHEELAAEYKTVVINAQTGKLLDRFDKSKDGWGDADYQGFVSWEDVK